MPVYPKPKKHPKLENYPVGNHVWAFEKFKQDALPSLLNDLGNTGLVGIPDEQCNLIKEAHQIMINFAATFPDGGVFRKAIWQYFEAYANQYEIWNDIEGNDLSAKEARKKELRKLRKARNELARAVRVNKAIIDENLDIQLVTSVYTALSKVVQKSPETFIHLSKAIDRYSKLSVST